MIVERYLNVAQARNFYNRMGKRQDWQRIYEGQAIDELLRQGEFTSANAVFELGCGTGALAEKLLSHDLPPEATYVGVDISPVMVKLARQRLAPFGERARVFQTEGKFDFSRYTPACDRFISVYVLDLLPPEAIHHVLDQAYALLQPQGRLGLISLTEGRTPVSRATMVLWQGLWRISPLLVGGCRPLNITPYLLDEQWQINFDRTINTLGVPSEIVLASKK